MRSTTSFLCLALVCCPALARAQPLSPERVRALAEAQRPSLVRVRATVSVAMGRLPGLSKGTRRTQQVSVGGVVVSADGLVLLPAAALDPARSAYALLGAPASAQVLSVRVVGSDGRIRDADWLGEDPQTRLGLVRVSPPGREGLRPVSWGEGRPELGDSLLVLSLTPAPLGTHLRAEPVRVSFVAPERWGLSPGLLQSLGGLVLDGGGAPLALVSTAALPLPESGDLLRPDLLAVNQASYALPRTRFAAFVASPPGAPPQVRQRRGRAWLGIRGEVLTPELAQRVGAPVDVGVRIAELYEGPAKAAGLQVGDVLLRMDGEPLDLDPGESFDALVEDYNVGEKVPFVVRRGSKQREVVLELARGPLRPVDAERLGVEGLGLELRALTFFDRRAAGLAADAAGAVVVRLEADGGASRAGLLVGDLLLAVDGEAPRSLADLREALLAPGAHVLKIRRRGKELSVRVRP
ncbi:MAG: PDZ domain-containing protein [Planctomycetota bacterium]|nr:MAG: PDZ domain-containing protein [Planctomycetota bacterium]